MADLTQTVTNRIPIMAMSPAVYWGTLVWGTDNWGFDGDTITEFEKGIVNSTSITTAIYEDIEHLVGLGTIALSDALGKDMDKAPLTETLLLSEDVASLTRGYGIWDYVFTKPSSDGVNAVYDVSSKIADDESTTWTKTSDGSTDWSQL